MSQRRPRRAFSSEDDGDSGGYGGKKRYRVCALMLMLLCLILDYRSMVPTPMTGGGPQTVLVCGNEIQIESDTDTQDQISGCSGNLRPEDLITFLTRHAAVPVVFGPSPVSQPPDTIILTVEKLSMAQALLRLSGIRYAGNKLRLEASSSMETLMATDSPVSAPPSSSSSSGTRINDIFSAFIQSRYSAPSKYLNMDAIMDDQAIRQIGINIFQHESSERLGAALCKLMATLCPNVGRSRFIYLCLRIVKYHSHKRKKVESISLAKNRLRSLTVFSSLPKLLPRLENLSFEDNALSSFKDLDGFPGRDFVVLKRVIFKGNPFVEKEARKSDGDVRYKR